MQCFLSLYRVYADIDQQVNLINSGTWLFTTDQYHVHENYNDATPQGWLARDQKKWVRSHQMVRTIVKPTNAKIIYDHDKETFFKYKHAPDHYD